MGVLAVVDLNGQFSLEQDLGQVVPADKVLRCQVG